MSDERYIDQMQTMAQRAPFARSIRGPATGNLPGNAPHMAIWRTADVTPDQPQIEEISCA
ncbi:MAG: hypothetical protein R3E83_06440 [Burkholderiaceae bacterium]